MSQHPFQSIPHEHPMDHIERFEDLVSSIKVEGVSDDYLFCKLFPYSLAGEAAVTSVTAILKGADLF